MLNVKDLTKDQETHALAGGLAMLFLFLIYALPTATYAMTIQRVFTGWTMLILTILTLAVMPILHFTFDRVWKWLYPLTYQIALDYMNKGKT